MYSWLFLVYMSCNISQIPKSWLHVVILLLWLFLKSMTYGLKVTNAVICLLINILSPKTASIICSPAVFRPSCMVWASQYLIPHLSLSPLQFGNKATWKTMSHFTVHLFHALSHDTTSAEKRKEKFRESFNTMMSSSIHVRAKCNLKQFPGIMK